MTSDCSLNCSPEGTRFQFDYPTVRDASSVVCEAPPVCKPRHPENTAFYQLFENYFDSYLRAYEERFEPRSWPLRPVVVRSVWIGRIGFSSFR